MFAVLMSWLLFFFQAEDGIRDANGTENERTHARLLNILMAPPECDPAWGRCLSRDTNDTKSARGDTRTIHPVGLMVSSEALQMSIISPSASGSSPASPNRCREALRDNEP